MSPNMLTFESVSAVQFDQRDLRRAAKSLITEFGKYAPREAEREREQAEAAGLRIAADYWIRIKKIVEDMAETGPHAP